ncbi:ribonuclease H-like domain-containing protein [Tanacetum coccineum]
MMYDPNITIEEYIRLEEEKARKRGKVFNWETAKYGKIWYDEDIRDLRSVETKFPAIAFNDGVSSEKTLSWEPTFSYKIISTNDLKTDSENVNEKVNMPSLPPPEPTISCFDDLDFFKNFENEFPAIVYNDGQTSKSESLTEPILSPQHIDEFDLNDKTSLSEYDEEEQNVLYFNDLFPFNIIHPGDLKSEKDNDDNEVDIIQSLGDMALLLRDQRHQYLRYEGLQYTDADIADFETRLARIYRREVHRVFGEAVTDLDTPGALQFRLEGARRRLSWRQFIVGLGLHTGEEMESPGISSAGDFLGTAPSYTAVRDSILRLCHRLIVCSNSGRSQAHKKVIVTGLFYLRGMDVGSVNVPYLLARYLRLFAAGRKSGALIFGALGPEKRPDVAAGAHEATKDALAVDDDMPLAVPPPPRTQGERIARLEEEVHGMRLGQSEVLDHMARDFSRIKLGNHNLWDIIVDGHLQEEVAPAGEKSGPPAPETAKQLTAKRNQERVKSILLLAIPDEYLLKFHNVPDAKSLRAAIKSSLDKAYDRFQKLISQLEVHAAPVSKEDINQKFLRSLPPSWSQIALIMRNKPDIDQTDIDDLYNNFKVYEDEIKRTSSSTSNSQNLAFLSSENTSSTNEVSTTSGNFGVNTAGGTNSSSQIDQDDLEELDIRWQVAMLTVRVQRFIQKTRRNLDFKGKQPITFDKSKVKCYNCHRKGHFAKECKSGRNQGKRSYGDNGRRNATTNKSSSQALVAQDGLGGYDWSNDFDEPVNYALMAISSSSSSSSSNNKVQNCSKQCLESFKTLQKNFDSEREKHSRARLEIQGYELALESLESRILDIKRMNWLGVKNMSFKTMSLSAENQMSAKDKNGLGYGTQLDEMSNKSETDSEISMSVFEVRSSDEEITPANDRFSKADGYHAVPPPITENFLTSRADISFAGLDKYVIRKKIIESKTTELNTDTSKSKTSDTVGKTNEVNIEKPKSVHESVVSKPKINRDKVIIEDWYSDDEDDVSVVK